MYNVACSDGHTYGIITHLCGYFSAKHAGASEQFMEREFEFSEIHA